MLVSGHMGDTTVNWHEGRRPLVQHALSKQPEVHVPATTVAGRRPDNPACELLADEHLAASSPECSVRPDAAVLEAIAIGMQQRIKGRNRRRPRSAAPMARRTGMLLHPWLSSDECLGARDNTLLALRLRAV